MSLYRVVQRQAATAEHDRATAEADRVRQLQLAPRELDHRTMNNFQLASAVLRAQHGRDSLPELREALDAAAQKLFVLTAVHRKLTYNNGDLGKRPLAPLLEEVVEALRGHLTSDKIAIKSELTPVDVTHECALNLALIVNELVTNALKHAFPAGKGLIVVSVETAPNAINLIVADDGVGRSTSRNEGSGSRLIDMLAKSIRGQLSYTPGPGTRVHLVVPIP